MLDQSQSMRKKDMERIQKLQNKMKSVQVCRNRDISLPKWENAALCFMSNTRILQKSGISQCEIIFLVGCGNT